MRMFRRIVLILAAIVIILIAIGYLLPQRVAVARSVEIDAPAEAVFPLVADLREVGKWSPWLGIDPNIRTSFSGPDVGVGQVMRWSSSDPQVGEGSQTVTEYDPPSRVVTALDFGAQGNAVATTTVEPSGAGSRVTWEFETDLGMNPVARYFGIALERMIAPDFENGLAALKRVAEAETTAPPELAPGGGIPPGPGGTTGTGSPNTAPATPQAGGGTGASGSSFSDAPPPAGASTPAPTVAPDASATPQSSTAPSATTEPSGSAGPSIPQSSQPPVAPQAIAPTAPPTPPAPQTVAPLTPPPPAPGPAAPVAP